MVTIQISEDLLVSLQSQLKGLQEALQRLQEQVAVQKGQGKAVEMKPPVAGAPAAVAAVTPAETRPMPPREVWPLPVSPRLAVAEAVGKQSGVFGIGTIKEGFRRTMNESIPDSTIRRLLEEMTDDGELLRVSRATGRLGNKYRLVKRAAGEEAAE